MATMILNGLTNRAFPIQSYSRNTTISNGVLSSEAFINADYSDTVASIMKDNNVITHIQIRNNDNQVIYTLSNIEAELYNMNEFLEDNRVAMNLTIRFNPGQAAQVGEE